jgi:hypothetical protein
MHVPALNGRRCGRESLLGEVACPCKSASDMADMRDVTFAFVTGYGGKGLRTLYCDRPTLQKPFRRRELGELFAELCRLRQT